MRPLPHKSRSSGFSLVELMVVMAIAAIAIGAIYGVFASVQKTSTSNEVVARVMQSLRTAVGVMESDIRMAGLDRFDTAGAGIEAAAATLLRFTADRNMDGAINTADVTDGVQEQDLERITYSYDGANRRLRQCLSEGTLGETWDTVAENVQGFQLSYFDADDAALSLPIADLTLIRSVAVTMTEIHAPAPGLSPRGVGKVLSGLVA